MSERNPKEIVPISAWYVNGFRTTVFTTSLIQADPQEWWMQTLKEPPEIDQSQPKKNERRLEGIFNEGKLVLILQPNRIDWLLGPGEKEIEGIPAIGRFPQVIDKFGQVMSTWFGLTTCPSSSRIAFGAVLIIPVSDLVRGYKEILKFLPFDLDMDPINTSDFFYQINRRRESEKFKDLRVNRLSKWSVASWRDIHFSVDSGGAKSIPADERFGLRLELDINTDPKFDGTFTQDLAFQVFSELVDFGKEIACYGDIP